MYERYATRCCVCRCNPKLHRQSHPVVRDDKRLFSYISCDSAYCLWRTKIKVDAYPVVDLWPWRWRIGPVIVYYPKSISYMDGI